MILPAEKNRHKFFYSCKLFIILHFIDLFQLFVAPVADLSDEAFCGDCNAGTVLQSFDEPKKMGFELFRCKENELKLF